MSNIASVLQIINESTGLDLEASAVSPDSLLDDLGLDSLDVYNILVEFEVKTGVQVNEEDADKFLTIKDLLNFFYRD